MTDPFLSIIIPAHNEAERLPNTLKNLRLWLARQSFSAEVLVVENASTDCTADTVRALQADWPELQLLQRSQAGKGGAIREGMLTARGQYRFMADADFSMPVEEIIKFLPPQCTEVDLALASREARGAQRLNEPAYRHIIGRVFNCLVRLIALPGIQDSQCGFKCFTASAAEQIFPQLTLDGWSFDVEALVIARELGLRLHEVPVLWIYNKGSRISVVRDSLNMARDLFRIRHNRSRGLYRGQKN